MQKLILFMLKRYLRFDKTQPFISITGILAFLGVGVGVMVLLVTMSIMNGMSEEFKKKLFVMNYPLTIFATTSNKIDSSLNTYLEQKFKDLKFSPFLRSQAIIKQNNEMKAVLLYGVDLQKERDVNEIVDKYTKGLDFNNPFSVILGANLANNLFLKNHDKITMIFTNLTPAGTFLLPRMKTFEILNTYSSGLNAYDSAIAYTSMDAISALNNDSSNDLKYDGIHVFSKDPLNDIKLLKSAIKQYHETHFYQADIEGWWQQNGNFFSAMELEKKALFIVLMLIILMASLNIISSLLMVVMNRRKEIALLIILGASKKEVKKIFLTLGLCIGGGGVIFGICGAFVVMEILKVFPIIQLPVDVYGISTLPINLLMSDFIYTVIGSVIIVYLSSYYPAKKAANINPLEVLRNE